MLSSSTKLEKRKSQSLAGAILRFLQQVLQSIVDDDLGNEISEKESKVWL